MISVWIFFSATIYIWTDTKPKKKYKKYYVQKSSSHLVTLKKIVQHLFWEVENRELVDLIEPEPILTIRNNSDTNTNTNTKRTLTLY